jgi:uncharacterized membrane protein YphA (DoxX/SURF4 family)
LPGSCSDENLGEVGLGNECSSAIRHGRSPRTGCDDFHDEFSQHHHGIPGALVPTLIVAARALQLIAGLGLILGIYPRIAALALLLFLIPATLMAHAFWLAMGTSLYMVQLINFFKNVSMAGGLIFIIATGSQPTLLPRPARADSNPCA